MFSRSVSFLGMRRALAAFPQSLRASSVRSSIRPDSNKSNGAKNRRQALGFGSTLGLFLILSLSGPAGAHHAVLRSNLEEMTVAADRVFLGKCISVQETERMIAQGMMPVTDYTFQVERAIKGNLPSVVTFTQLGHAAGKATGKGGERSEERRVGKECR